MRKIINMNWNKVSESLPTENGLYIIFAKSLDKEKPLLMTVFFDTEAGWSLVRPWAKAVSHWMSMPAWPDDE